MSSTMFRRIQKIEVYPFDYSPEKQRFVFEASEKSVAMGCHSIGGKNDVILVNPITSNEVKFKYERDDESEGEVYGWNYRSECGRFTLLIIND